MCKRGEIYNCDLGEVVGSEQGGVRPVLVVQNNVGNKFSTTTIVVAMTTQRKPSLPVHLTATGCGLREKSTILCEQVRTVDKVRLCDKIGMLNDETMKQVDKALRISLLTKLEV